MEIKHLAHDEGLSENIILLLEAVGRVQIIKYYQGITQSCTNVALFNSSLDSIGCQVWGISP